MHRKKHYQTINRILSDAKRGQQLTMADIGFLLRLTQPEDQQLLFSTARHVRNDHFETKIFFYGFVYFNTYCRNNCAFCRYRRSNTNLPRYRKNLSEIVHTARKLAAAGVHLIDLTMGETPEIFNNGRSGFEKLIHLAAEVKRSTNLPVMVSPGVLPEETLAGLAQVGVDWYACYQETHDPILFKQLRETQDYHQRLNQKISAKQHGMLIEEGILTGVGESIANIIHSMAVMQQLNADQVRAMTFVPQQGVPMGTAGATGAVRELMTIAVLRLVFPNRLIPASLDVDGLRGLKDRLKAGANVITSLVSPGGGWTGVANRNLDIDEAHRTPDAVKPILKTQGLRAATLEEYNDWMIARKTCFANGRAGNHAISRSVHRKPTAQRDPRIIGESENVPSGSLVSL